MFEETNIPLFYDLNAYHRYDERLF